MKKYFYNYQTITRFDIPVIKHFFLLRCMPCVNACQQGSHKELFLHPSDSVIYGADSWGNPIQYGHKLDSHDSFTFVSSGEARILPYCIPNEKNTDMFKVASPLTEPSEAIKEFARIHKKGKNDVDTALNYANELYWDAKANAQRRDRLQRRLDKLTREQRQDLKHQMKQRIFKAGIEYYEARAKYCYYLVENACIREFKIWTDCMLDDWTGDSDI